MHPSDRLEPGAPAALEVAIIARLPGRRQALAELAREAGLQVVAILPFAPAEPGAAILVVDGEPADPVAAPAVILGAESRPFALAGPAPSAWLAASPTPLQLRAAVAAVTAGLVVHAPLHRPGDSAGEPLTPRELEVLRCLADGDANRAIALRLGISENTVKFHVAAILAKLSAQSRADAVMRAVQRGLLPV